jgi:hypothetical protein
MLTGELFRWSFFDCPRLVTQFTFLPYMNAKTACFDCMGCQHAPHLSRGNTQSATMPLTFPRHHLRCRNHNALTMIRLTRECFAFWSGGGGGRHKRDCRIGGFVNFRSGLCFAAAALAGAIVLGRGRRRHGDQMWHWGREVHTLLGMQTESRTSPRYRDLNNKG